MKRHLRFRIKRRRLWDFDAAARSAYAELVERDKQVLVGWIERVPEDAVLIVARGDRAGQLIRSMRALGVTGLEDPRGHAVGHDPR